MALQIETDAVVVGAGSSGAAAACCLAEAGLRVHLLDARPLDRAGATWSDDLPPWMFDRARIPRPAWPEARNHDVPYLLMSPSGGRVRLEASPMWAVDVRLLSARLRQGAVDRGAIVSPRTRAGELLCDADGRPHLLHAEALDGTRRETREYRARLFVDAGGIGGVLRRQVPALARCCPDVGVGDLCSAAQYVCDIADRSAAAAFLGRIGAMPGTFMAWAGVNGGFSTCILHPDDRLDEIGILTGMAWDGRTPGARRMMDELRHQHPWIGPVRFGGEGLIPIRRPYERLSAPGIALVGDAGCQVFPPSGCGIGSALIASRMLADSVSGHDDPGSIEAMWAYQAAFHRDRGAVHAAYDVFRRMTQSLSGPEVSGLLECGLMTAGSATAALDQRMPAMGPGDLARTIAGAARRPILAARMSAALPRMFAVHAAHAFHPARPDEAALRRWSRRVAALVGDRPGVT